MNKTKAQAVLEGEKAITENSNLARDFFDKSRFGIMLADSRVQLSILESVYLVEKNKMDMLDGRGKIIPENELVRKAKRINKDFEIKYAVFRDLRDRGYIIKTALKFGADFRVYERGVKPGEDHAKWVVFPVHESRVTSWHEFSAKNRVAHSTKKRLLIGVVDDENDVSYWECRWIKP